MRTLFLSLVVLIGLSGCSSKEDMAKAEAGVEQFHKDLNDAAFDQIYEEASDGMKANSTQEKLVKFLSAVHRKLGNFQSASSTGWKVFAATGGTTVTLSYSSIYEQGTAAETFVFLIAGGKAILQGYNINSDELIEN